MYFSISNKNQTIQLFHFILQVILLFTKQLCMKNCFSCYKHTTLLIMVNAWNIVLSAINKKTHNLMILSLIQIVMIRLKPKNLSDNAFFTHVYIELNHSCLHIQIQLRDMALQIQTYRFVTLYIIYSLKILLCEISNTSISKSYNTRK